MGVFNKLIVWWDRYERILSGGSLIVGFIFDLFLAKRPDSVYDNVLLVCYLFIAAAIILILNLRMNRRREVVERPAPLLLILILQFCFGGLSSNLLVLYGKSGTLADSALFILLLFGMLIGNEFLKTRYAQLRFNIVIYYTLLLTYLIIAVPTFLLHAVGTWVFLTSGVLSLLIISVFLYLVYLLVFRGRERSAQIYEVSVLVGLVFVLYSVFYFLNIIPPVPLSLKSIGTYHTLTKESGGDYSATYEAAPWYVFWRDTSSTYTVATTSGGQATCFSSVFAPTALSANVFQRWEKFNEATNSWDTVTRISFPINGGRAGGYRGFTNAIVTPGKWRCDVETQGGALIGRISFTVVESPAKPAISQTTL
jgi:hypothetical protein